MPHHTSDDRALNHYYHIAQDYDHAEEQAILRDFHFRDTTVAHRGVQFDWSHVQGFSVIYPIVILLTLIVIIALVIPWVHHSR